MNIAGRTHDNEHPWRAQVESMELCAIILANMPHDTQWGVAITDEDQSNSPSTFNIFAYSRAQEKKIEKVMAKVLGCIFNDNGESLHSKHGNLLVSIIRQWEE